MAQIVWARRAIADLAEIAEYIALDDEAAAVRLTERVYSHVEILSDHPRSGSIPLELEGREYRQIIEPPCRVFYKVKRGTVYIVHIIRSERILRLKNLRDQE